MKQGRVRFYDEERVDAAALTRESGSRFSQDGQSYLHPCVANKLTYQPSWIDVDEWRAATEYNGYTASNLNVVWRWRALKSFNHES
jgi:hypothetical protein